MKTGPQTTPGEKAFRRAFTLVEVLVTVAIVGTSFVSLYSGISMGFALINVSRENLRAVQILQEKVETIRLYNWDQINSNGFIPATFSEPFYPQAATNSGLLYNGTVVVTNAPISESYRNDLRLVVLNVSWTSGNVTRQREMQTYIARYGLQNYLY